MAEIYVNSVYTGSNYLDQSWVSWNSVSTTNTVTATQAWTGWNGSTSSFYIQSGTVAGYLNQCPSQHNQMERQDISGHLDRLDEARRLAEEQAAKRQAAKDKARTLLLNLLDTRQKEQWENENAFELSTGDRLYRVRLGGVVEELDRSTKKVISRFCIHPPRSCGLPPEDVAASQKLLLEADETEFRRIANETRVAA